MLAHMQAPQRQASVSLLPTFGLGSSSNAAEGSDAWDMSSLADALANVGGGISEGITSLATNITGWVADLASAFDAGWGEDEEEGEAGHARTHEDKDAPAVGIGGALGIERPYQRRAGVANVSSGGGHTSRLTADMEPRAEGEEGEGEIDDDDWKKDD